MAVTSAARIITPEAAASGEIDRRLLVDVKLFDFVPHAENHYRNVASPAGRKSERGLVRRLNNALAYNNINHVYDLMVLGKFGLEHRTMGVGAVGIKFLQEELAALGLTLPRARSTEANWLPNGLNNGLIGDFTPVSVEEFNAMRAAQVVAAATATRPANDATATNINLKAAPR